MKGKFKQFATAMLCMVLVSAWAQPAETPKPLARMANGEVVSDKDLADYLERRMDLRPVARNAWGVEATVQEMAMTRVLVLEGERLGVPRKAAEGARERFDDVYGLSVYRKQAPACEAPANEEEARRYFDAHPKAFGLPVQARVQRVILPAKTQIAGMSAMAWLQEQAGFVAKKQRQFSAVAQRAQLEYSQDVQGDLGWLSLEGDHQFMRALQTVKAGELLGPAQDGDYVYLFSVEQRREARQLTWEESKSFAKQRAVSYCREEAQTSMRTDLFKQYGVEIDRQAIRELVAKANAVSADKAEEKSDGKPDAPTDAKSKP
ncbi:MAG: peptidyl-prolyl cis-trans isomerase [Burkholderiales bacterium]|nr:peptidyl-prolyl cis-trans isomerase [Burkholderiales bacterium]